MISGFIINIIINILSPEMNTLGLFTNEGVPEDRRKEREREREREREVNRLY